MPLTRDVIEAAPEVAAGVVRDWRSLAEQFHWTRDSIDEDHLAELICKLGEAALARESGSLDASRELVRAALQHGRDRHDDGFSEEMLFREYHLLRRGLWEQLKRKNPEGAAETIMRIDSEITMATSASLQGFHRSHAEVADESHVDQTAERWAT